MRKPLLCISLFFSFLLCFAGSGRQVPVAEPHPQQEGYTFLSFSYPHNEIEIPHSVAGFGNSARPQVVDNFIEAANAIAANVSIAPEKVYEVSPVLTSKRYLLHIYPSHNFW